MKKNEDRLLNKTFKDFVITLFLVTFCVPLVLFISIFFITQLDFGWLYNYSPNLYYQMRELFGFLLNDHLFLPFLLLLWVILVLLLLYRLLKKVFSYLHALSEATQKLLNKEIEYVKLPSELEDMEIKLNHLKKESLQNERLAKESEQKKNDLIVYLAHDLKTPLTSMIGYLSLLDEIKDMPCKQREKYINIALDKSYKLEDLINELFEITRFNAETIVLEKEEINLNMMIEQMIDDFYPLLKEMDREICYTPKEGMTLLGDSDKLARVCNNLIRNAIYYSTDKKIEIYVDKKEEEVLLTIKNKGRYLPEEKLNRIFERFYRLDSARMSKTGGSGLGLAIAKEIVELHGGKISVTSDEYITFRVELPIVKNTIETP